MLQRNSDGNRGQWRKFFALHPVHADLRLRRNKSSDMAERRAISYGRQCSCFHLAGDIDVVSGIRPREILTVFRQGGKSGDSNQQKQNANLEAKSPISCSSAKQVFML
jgi:hypothetical protein